MTKDLEIADEFDDFNETNQHNDDDDEMTDEEFRDIFGDLDFDDDDTEEDEKDKAPADNYDLHKNDSAPQQKYGGSITSVRLTLGNKYDKAGFALGAVRITLSTRRGMQLDNERLRCYIYTDDFYPMCNSDDSATRWQLTTGKSYVTIPCSRPWMPGRYFLMIHDKRDAMARFDFTVGKHLKPSVPKRRDCLFFGPEDVHWSCLEASDSPWQRLAVQPGAAQLRQYAIKAVQHDLYNRYCSDIGYGTLANSNDLTIYTMNNDIGSDILDALAKIALPSHRLTVVDCTSLYDSTTMNPYEHLGEVIGCPSMCIFCLTNVGALLTTGGKVIVRKLLEMKAEYGERSPLWICGPRQDVDSLFDLFPSLRNLFLETNRLSQERYTIFEQVQNFIGVLGDEHMAASYELTCQLTKAVADGYRQGLLSTWSLADIRRFVAEKVRPSYQERVMKEVFTDKVPALEKADLHLELLSNGHSAYEDSIAELRQMVGLDDIKQSILKMADNTRFATERRRRGLTTTTNATYHAIFTGNPGTGKTTVARQLGRIYHALGLLSKGDVISVDRTRLVGRYIGETEENMKFVLDEARGNVLFIDEAYTLHDGGGDRKDYGARVIDSLLTVLSRPDPDMMVIFAGYEKQMEDMLNTNPGLLGRFPYKFNFKDYSADQLVEIALHLLQHDEYILTDEALAALRDVVAQTVARRDANFGNARWVEQFVKNGIIPAMATRVLSSSTDDYQRVEAADIRKAHDDFNTSNATLKPRRKVGFS